MNYDGILQFKYTWRTYQARVLQRADPYLADGKIHIVAAPGSGKTTLGIELIRRLNRNALVLAPTVTIREQWMDRIREAFLCEGMDDSDYLSQDLKHPEAITVATYQALHSAMLPLCGAEKAEDAGDAEGVGSVTFAMAGFAYMVSRFPKLFLFGSPFRRRKAFGGGIRKALESKGLFEEPANRVEAEILAADRHAIYLLGGTGRDKALFAKCVSEFFEPLENQRYILVSQKRRKGNTGYFAVPDCFSGRREDAEFFASCMRPYIGKYTAVYTRNEEGRKLLLKGRAKAFANRGVRCITHEKVKGAFE